MKNSMNNPQILWSSNISTKESQSQSWNGIENTMNVQVILRCRPVNEEEKSVMIPLPISWNEHNREVTVVQNMYNQQIDKSFIFDGVFRPNSLQKDLFEQVVIPIINEALEGYICTILAYGQSGTGKTYTMEGQGNIHKNGAFEDDAGVIPRAVQHIFDILEIQKAEYTMKVTYLELYNEEITDLLIDEKTKSEENQKKAITLMEDGKGNVYLRGLEEIEVKSAYEVYNILDEGFKNKHTTETLFNEKSNCSHSIFSISIQKKDCFQDGEEIIKYGKLNFVDLAGSENIMRSGASEERAKGAGKINKSLLTLGRVINALVEHYNHVPYRDSKLTRLLRDSLGGKTKTCLIATISPSINCLDETLNTLEYAYRAKKIINRPEVNQKVLRSAQVNDLYTEIDHLKKELHAIREKNGIYIPEEQYLNEQTAKKAMIEKIQQIELDLGLKEEKVKEIQELCANQQKSNSDLNERHERTKRDFERTVKSLAELEEKYRQASQTIKEKEYLIYNLLGSEKGLTETAFQLRAELENAATKVSSLLQDIDNKSKKEGANRVIIQNFRCQLIMQLQDLHKIVADSVTKQEQQLKAIEEDTQLFFSEKSKATDQLKARVEELKIVYASGLKQSEDLAKEIKEKLQIAYGSLKTEQPKRSKSVTDSFRNFVSEADVVVDDLQKNLIGQKEKIALFVKQQQEAHFRTSHTTQIISIDVMDFFNGLSSHISKLELLAHESQKTDKELCALENKLGEYAANEEKQLLDKFAEMLASSNARKKLMEKQSIDGLRESVAKSNKQLDQETLDMKELTTYVEQKWTSYVENMGVQCIEDSKIVDLAKDELEEFIKHCEDDAEQISEQWRDAEQCISCLQKTNDEFVDSVIKKGLEANEKSRVRAASTALSRIDKINAATNSFLSSLEYIKELDEDASKKYSYSIAPCCENMRQMETNHSYGTDEIIQNSEKCLIKEYKVDEYVETKKLVLDLPSVEKMEELKTPPLEDLLKSFRGDKLT